MCAIGGWIGMPGGEKSAEAMLASMSRRGPDDKGIYWKDDCLLLHTRLAIIDPNGGKQPMELLWEKENYILIYNGELYNTAELTQELTRLGHVFSDHSDTQVILHAYAQWGEKCLERLNGIFAFAVWETGSKKLFMARDRIGVKPLFYTLYNGGVLFGSELKTILAYPGFRAELSEEGAAEILLLGPGRTPGCGVFRGVRELEPGCWGVYQNGIWHQKRYWHLQDREHVETFEQTAEQVRFLVTDSIRRQMVSDVPLGTFLSGGLDSSLITAVCAEEYRKQGRTLPTFSVDYQNNDRYFRPGKFQPSFDSPYIRKMTDAFQTDHHWTVLTPVELAAALEEAVEARDLPGMADVDSSMLLFCRQIRNSVKVALSGECADEIFGGYPWYRDPEIREAEGFPWAQNITNRCRLMAPVLADKINGADYIRDRYLQTCRESDILPGISGTERRMKEMINLNFRWFMQTLLDRKDRMSMYSGLEVRVPFCDYRIAEYLYGVPWEFKDYRNQEKGLLRYAMRDLLPDEILWRKKSPYPKTMDPKYEKLVSGRLTDALTGPLGYLISRREVEAMLSRENSWPWYGQLMQRPQTIAYLLQVDFWLRKYHVEFTF